MANRASAYRAAYVDHVMPKQLPIFQMRGDGREYRATVEYDGSTRITISEVEGDRIASIVLPEAVMIEFGLWNIHAYGKDDE